MPSVSSKQARFMAAAAHNKDFAKKAGIPQSVAKEFNDADSGKSNPQENIIDKNEASKADVKAKLKKKSKMATLYNIDEDE